MEIIIIVTGGHRNIDHYRRTVNNVLKPYYVIGVDAGATWLLENDERIDVAVGDFDTIGKQGVSALIKANVELVHALPEKDETDTELAVSLAIQKNTKRILIYGGIGTRFDHSLANIHLLWKCHQEKIPCEIIDPWNRIQLIDQPAIIYKDHTFISLIPFTQVVRGVTLSGFKYPLNNATLEWGSSLGVSNELVLETGTIELSDGVLLVIMSNDDMDRNEERE